MLAFIDLSVINRLSVAFQIRVIDISWQDGIRSLCLAVYILSILGLILDSFLAWKFGPERQEVPEADRVREVERYRKPTRLLHWGHAASFVILLGSGLVILFFPGAALSGNGWLRIMHRVAGIVFIGLPLLYLLVSGKTAWWGIKLAFKWGLDDFKWVRVAPEYYYIRDERTMPPQGFFNTAQKVWWLMVIVLGPVIAVTGVFLWIFGASATTQLYQLVLFIHIVSFIISGNMLLIHIYLAVIHPVSHPLKTGPWGAMTGGKVTMGYARARHGKWADDLPETGENR